MVQLSPQNRKKRRVQLRDAQRRRRARLKDEAKSFLQVILNDEVLNRLREHSRTIDRPVQLCAADLIAEALLRKVGEPVPVNTHASLECEQPTLNSQPVINQMDLFAG
jgi:hypothetical protein